MTFLRDLRHGARTLLASPGFSLIVIASIAVAVGVNTTMFSLADGLVLRPLAVSRPHEIVTLATIGPEGVVPRPALAYPDYLDIRDRARSFASLVGYREVVTAFDAAAEQPAVRTIGAAVSADYFEAMGIRPRAGRFFRADEDDVPGRDPLVVLDHRTWTERFGASPDVIGRRVRIASTTFTVIGVAPATFTGLEVDTWPAFYVPLTMLREAQNPPGEELTRRDLRGMRVKGRLREGVSLAQARDEIGRIGEDLARAYPATNRSQRLTVRTEWQLRTSGPDAALIGMLMTLAMVVLIVACANVAGLLTSRAPARARDVAVRLALGAGRWRIVRQLLTESLLLATVGGAIGLLLAYGGIRMLQRIEFPTEVPLKLGFALDRRVLVVALVATALSAVTSSLIPALRATRRDVLPAIKGTPYGRRPARQWGRHSLVCVQVALSLVVLTVAAALAQAVSVRLVEGPGFRTDGMLIVRFDDRMTGFGEDRARQFYTLLTERAAALPGVTSIALTSSIPFKVDTSEGTRIVPEGVQLPPGSEEVPVRSARVDGGFFATMGIPLLAGRGFARDDARGSSPVAVVNRALVDRFWPGEDVVGKRVRVQPPGGGDAAWHEIVGVAATIKQDWLGEAPQPAIYLARTQSRPLQNVLLVRTGTDPATLTRPVVELVRDLDPAVTPFGIRTMDDLYERRGVAIPRMIVRITTAMGTMGLLLALVGLYGLVAYAVSRRTREIGIRVALGATPQAVLGLVMGRGFLVTAAGLAVGAAGSVAANVLFMAAFPSGGGITPRAYATVIPAVLAVALLAAYVPARRAAGIEPVGALRME